MLRGVEGKESTSIDFGLSLRKKEIVLLSKQGEGTLMSEGRVCNMVLLDSQPPLILGRLWRLLSCMVAIGEAGEI